MSDTARVRQVVASFTVAAAAILLSISKTSSSTTPRRIFVHPHTN